MTSSASSKDFGKHELAEGDLSLEPIAQFSTWWRDAFNNQVNMPDAAVLSTIGLDNHPDARVIFIKEFDERGLVFFTNYLSAKGQALAANPHACLTFFWPELERQVRVRGLVTKTNRSDSENYFKSRSRGAQLGAWASRQSEKLSSRLELDQAVKDIEAKFNDQDVPCPPHWGGLRLSPDYFEFWQGRKNRLHDRFMYERKGPNSWSVSRLSP